MSKSQDVYFEDLVADYKKFFEKFCRYYGLELDHEQLRETPRRVVSALLELTSGYTESPDDALQKCFSTPLYSHEDSSLGGSSCEGSTATYSFPKGILVVHNAIPYISLCAHHLLPFYGYMYVGMLLKEKILGLSKVTRVVRTLSRRLQVQEELTHQVASSLSKFEGCIGAAVVSDGVHGCMMLRGVRSSSVTTCSSLTGVFRTNDENIKEEFFSLVQRRQLFQL